ncbi:HAD family hydrolase [Nocardia shimofusensis]|uniref:HAD family hydrolase n=1 Tax=Nocardia shimofusensis TaxID=228596 RepID=UPI000836312A|nr:HAD-IA family hydrolase [Nocardia shimofusensis]
MAIEAVLFDFSGTLFRWEALPPWGADLVGADGRASAAEQIDPAGWTPYPDVGAVLDFLAAHGIPVGVVSNLAFDPRPAFARQGWDSRVAAFALSHEVGAGKPDPRIFQAALAALGVDPGAALMVGDSAVTDGGATELGCRFALVDPLPTAERPDALIDALRAHGLAVPR